MKRGQLIMGVPVTLEIARASEDIFEEVFAYFRAVDARFSTYKAGSEMSRINRGLPEAEWSAEMREMLALCAQTKQATGGYFDIIRPDGSRDPSGLVKGWAVSGAAQLIKRLGFTHFFVDGGGDVQVAGGQVDGSPWRVGIQSPFAQDEIVKVLELRDGGVATSGAYIRGQHIYNPFQPGQPEQEVASITLIAKDIYDADRYVTAAHAMGSRGIAFAEQLGGIEGYLINNAKMATMTSAFQRFAVNNKENCPLTDEKNVNLNLRRKA
jgi:thiamine biosynthesis lipoprotein